MAQEKAALVQGDERQSRREAIGIMVLPKLMFFLTTAAIASSGPYVPAFFDERGYNPTAIGLMMTIEPVVMILLGGPWGAFADKTQVRKFRLCSRKKNHSHAFSDVSVTPSSSS